MKMKLVSILAAVMLFPILLTGTGDAQAKSIELKFNYTPPKGEAPANGWEWFAKELDKQTGGKVKVITFPMQNLFKQHEAVENIVGRTAELANISLRTFATRYPLLAVTLLPTIRWPNNVKGTIAGGRAVMRLINEFPEIQQELNEFKVVWVQMLEGYYLFSKKPIRKPSDLKGLKIGAGGMQGRFVRNQGGSAVSIIPPKAYMNLKTGVVDGMVMSWNAVGTYKLWEVINYATEVVVGRVPMPIIMNKEAWNSLSPRTQKLMMNLGDESIPMSSEGMYEGGETGKKRCLEKGVKVFTPDQAQKAEWNKSFEPLETEWLSSARKKGLKAAPAILKRYKQMAAEAYK